MIWCWEVVTNLTQLSRCCYVRVKACRPTWLWAGQDWTKEELQMKSQDHRISMILKLIWRMKHGQKGNEKGGNQMPFWAALLASPAFVLTARGKILLIVGPLHIICFNVLGNQRWTHEAKYVILYADFNFVKTGWSLIVQPCLALISYFKGKTIAWKQPVLCPPISLVFCLIVTDGLQDCFLRLKSQNNGRILNLSYRT